MKPRTALKANVVFAALAIAASVYLTQVHYQSAGGSTNRSWCTLTTKVNCDLVATSEYSELFGAPISILGGLFYLFLLVLSVLGLLGASRTRHQGNGSSGRREAGVLLYTTLLSVGAVGYSVFLFYVSHYVLGAWCLFCSVLWALNALLLASSGAGLRMGTADAARLVAGDIRDLLARPLRLALVAVVGLGCVGLFGFQAVRYEKAKAAALARAIEQYRAERAVELPLTGKEPMAGDPNAPHTLVEWLDFRCGYCRRASNLIDTLLREFPGKLRVIVAQLPLDPTCDRLVPPESQSHLGSCAAAAAAVCAEEQGKYWEFHKEIFLDPDAIGPARIDRIARDLKLDLPAFQACVGSGAGTARVKDEIEIAFRVIQSLPRDSEGKWRVRTPMLILDGKQVPGLPPLAFWRKILE